jgi:hypothetical protein
MKTVTTSFPQIQEERAPGERHVMFLNFDVFQVSIQQFSNPEVCIKVFYTASSQLLCSHVQLSAYFVFHQHEVVKLVIGATPKLNQTKKCTREQEHL